MILKQGVLNVIKRILPLFVIVTAAGGMGQNINLQVGLTHIFHEHYYEGAKEVGYRGDVRWSLSFGKWELASNIRTLVFPGSVNAYALYIDISVPFYFTGEPVRMFVAPVVGYSHANERDRHYYGLRSKHDFLRGGCTFGLKTYSGRKWFTISYSLIPEFSTGEIHEVESWDGAIYLFSRFYVEWSLEAEFGWRFSDHVGLTAKGGIINRNYLLTKKTRGNFVPYGEAGPSFYF